MVSTNSLNNSTYLAGVLQGDIFSPVAFIMGLMRTFAVHDLPNSGVEVGPLPYLVRVSSLEYADDAGLLDDSAEQASQRLSAIASGSRNDAAMEISIAKTKAYQQTVVSLKDRNLRDRRPEAEICLP